MFSQTRGPETGGICKRFYKNECLALMRSMYLGTLMVILVSPVSWVFPQQTTSTPDALPSARKQFDYGKQVLEQGKFAEATAVFRELLQTIPNSPLLYNLLGFCDLKQGHTDAAVVHFKKAPELKSDYKAAHNNLGGIYLMQGRSQEAIQEFSAVIRTDPKDAQAFYNLARAELATNNHEAGLDHLRTAHDLSPRNAPIAASRACHELTGYSCCKLGKADEAVEDLQKAMARDPRNQEYVLELAEVFVTHNNAAVAITLMETAARAFPHSSRIWFGWGAAYLADQHRSSAEAALKKSLELDPKLDLAYVVLGQSHKEAGTWAEL